LSISLLSRMSARVRAPETGICAPSMCMSRTRSNHCSSVKAFARAALKLASSETVSVRAL
jgi:hypothetical protein